MSDEIKWAGALLCKHCGKVVERGIFNVIKHYETCKGTFGEFEEVHNADYEIIEPKLLTDKTNVK